MAPYLRPQCRTRQCRWVVRRCSQEATEAHPLQTPQRVGHPALMPRLGVFESLLLQLGVFGFGLLEDGDVGVGIFPKREEILIGGLRPGRVT